MTTRWGALVAAIAVLAGASCVPLDPPTPPAPTRGPGVGHTTFAPSEVLTPVALIDEDQGIPFPPFLLIKQFGMNVVTMLNGYMVGLFAPDSGGGPGGFAIYDVGDPRRPTLVHRVYDPFDTTSRFREPHALPAARIGGRQVLAVPVVDGVELWDFTDVRDPRPLSHLPLYGIAGGDYFDANWQMSWQAPYLYIAGSNHGLFIVDTTDPTRPRLADRGDGRPNPVPTSELGGFRVGPVFAFGNQLVLSSMDNDAGLANLDLSDPVNPVLVSATGRSPQFYASCFDGTHAFLAVESPAAVASYRVAPPRSDDGGAITAEGSTINSDSSKYCSRKDELLISGNQEDISIYDVTDPSDMVELGRGSMPVDDPDHGQVTPIGNLVYVGNDHGTGNGLFPLSTEPDRRGPSVVETSPRDGEAGVSPTTAIGVSFSDNIALESLDATAFHLAPLGGEPVAVTASSWVGQVSVVPTTPLRPDTTYELRITAGGVRDVSGNPITTDHTVRFSTGADVARPIAVTATPTRSPVGTEVALRAVGGTGPHTWDLGDGAPPVVTDGPNLTQRYATPGRRRVTVQASSASGGPAFGATSLVTTRTPRWAATPTSSSPITIAGDLAVVANPDSATVSAVDLMTGAKRWETEVGDRPRTLTIDTAGKIWVTVQDADEVVALSDDGSILRRIRLASGSAPYGIAAVPNAPLMVVATEGRGQVLVLDTTTGAIVDTEVVGPDARGVSVTGDGAEVLVTRFRPQHDPTRPQDAAPALVHRIPITTDGQLGAPSRIELAVDTTTIDGEDRARGVANYLEQVVPNPDGAEAWVPSKKDNVVGGRFRDGTALTPETTVRSLVTRLDLGAVAPTVVGAIDVNDRAAARAVAFSPDGDLAFIAHMESNAITIVDAYTGEPVGAVADVGRAPIGLTVDSATGRLAVADLLSRSVSIYDAGAVIAGTSASPRFVARTPVVARELLSPQQLTGKRVFYDASDPRMTSHNYISCASCHQDGDTDGQVWDFTQRGEGLRSTPWLFGLSGTGANRLHFSANFDELADFENDIRAHFGGRGFLDANAFAATADPLGASKAGRSPELDAVAAYVRSLAVPSSPARQPDGTRSPSAVRGATVFVDAGCASCHSGPSFTDGRRHDVGTVDASSGRLAASPSRAVDTPSLLGVGRTAPYLHNGSVPTLSELLQRGHGLALPLAQPDATALVAYLDTLDGRP